MAEPADLLVVYDGSPSGDECVLLACALAKSGGRRIEVMSVAIVPPSLPLTDLPESFDVDRRVQLAHACELIAQNRLEARARVVHAYETWQGVLRECERVRPAGLFLALDWSPGRWLPSPLPTVARRVLRSVPCPVYFARSPGARSPSLHEAVAEAERVLHGVP